MICWSGKMSDAQPQECLEDDESFHSSGSSGTQHFLDFWFHGWRHRALLGDILFIGGF